MKEIFRSARISVLEESGLAGLDGDTITIKARKGPFVAIHFHKGQFIVSAVGEMKLGIHHGSPSIVISKS